MKKNLIMVFVVFIMATLCANAQQNLSGRVYHCANLVEKELGQMKKEAATIAKEAETEEEKKEVKGIDALMNAIVSTMTVRFIDGRTVEISAEAKFDEEKAKKGGASWMMRKIVRMKFGKGRSDKMQTTYTVNGRNIIVKGRKGNRIYVLSEDGKALSYVMERKKEKRTVILKRIQ